MRLVRADRKSLLLGTALASTLLVGVALTPTPAFAVVDCTGDFLPVFPIDHTGETEPIDCLNFLPRTGVLGFDAIALATTGDNNTIDLTNLATGILISTGLEVEGIFTYTDGANSSITIDNRAAVATAGIEAEGIYAFSTGAGSGINIVNSGPIATVGVEAEGIYARTESAGSPIIIVNSVPSRRPG